MFRRTKNTIKNFKAAIILSAQGNNIYHIFDTMNKGLDGLKNDVVVSGFKLAEEQAKSKKLTETLAKTEVKLNRSRKRVNKKEVKYRKVKKAHLAGDTPCVDEYFGKV